MGAVIDLPLAIGRPGRPGPPLTSPNFAYGFCRPVPDAKLSQ
jgi:hypothetical protein